ncbi:TrbC family F-type conjugative pilus assembly protein [Thiomicrolovo sp. ZZH C-3]
MKRLVRCAALTSALLIGGTLHAFEKPKYRIPDYLLSQIPEQHEELLASYLELFEREPTKEYALFYVTSSTVPAKSFLKRLEEAQKLIAQRGMPVRQLFRGVDTNLGQYTKMIAAGLTRTTAEALSVRLDPNYFSEHNVTAVPRIVLAECSDGEHNFLSDCESIMEMSGDVSIPFFFEKAAGEDPGLTKFLSVFHQTSKKWNNSDANEVEQW